MEEDDELQNSEEQNGQLDRTIKRFEEMRRNKEQYFFDVDALVKIIEHYTDTLQYEKALDVMLYAHSMHPQTVTLKLKEAHLYALMGKEQKALSLLEEVEHINPFDIDVHLIRGNIYNSLEQYPRAIACFKKALEMADEQRDDIYLSLAITYQNMADFNKAVDYYMLCLRENNANEVAMEEAIISFEFSRRLDDAIVFFTELIDDNPYAYMLWYYLGEVYCKLGQFEKALNAYDYCLLIKDDFAPAHLDMAQAFSMLERFQDAIDRYRIAFEYCQPDAFIYYNLGECHEQLQQFEEARTYYKKAVKLSPEMAQAWYGIGVTFEEEERWYEAMHYVKKAIEIDDQNGDYWLAYGDCEYRLNNHESAEESYKKVIDFDPENADGWIAYSDLLGELNRPLEAVEVLNSSILFHNENGEINYRLVCYLYAAGFIQEAYQQLEIALEKDPENFNIMFDVTPLLENDAQIQKLIEQKNK
jgi:tetratricopeptide (TPR) repeat protein